MATQEYDILVKDEQGNVRRQRVTEEVPDPAPEEMTEPGTMVFPEWTTPPSDPPPGYRKVHVRDDGKVYLLSPDGSETVVGPGPQGAVGPPGPEGPAGPAGPAGPPGSAGSGVIAKRVGAQVSNTLVTYADIPALSFDLLANKAYTVDWFIFFSAAAATTGLGLQLAGNTLIASGGLRARIEIATSATAMTSAVVTGLLTPLLATASSGATALLATIHGSILTGGVGGTLLPQFRSEVAGSAVNILPGSYGILTPL